MKNIHTNRPQYPVSWYFYQMATQEQVCTQEQSLLLDQDLFKAFDQIESSRKSEFILRKYLFSFMCAQHVLSYHLNKNHDPPQATQRTVKIQQRCQTKTLKNTYEHKFSHFIKVNRKKTLSFSLPSFKATEEIRELRDIVEDLR